MKKKSRKLDYLFSKFVRKRFIFREGREGEKEGEKR